MCYFLKVYIVQLTSFRIYSITIYRNKKICFIWCFSKNMFMLISIIDVFVCSGRGPSLTIGHQHDAHEFLVFMMEEIRINIR